MVGRVAKEGVAEVMAGSPGKVVKPRLCKVANSPLYC